MKIKIIVIVALITTLFASCSKEDVFMYDSNDSALYFDYLSEYPDSLNYIFYNQQDGYLIDTVFVKINVMGPVVDYDRPVKVMQSNLNEQNAAEQSVHYIPFDNAELNKMIFVPAHSNNVLLPVVVIRDSGLKTKEVSLKIGIVENEHFRLRKGNHQNYTVTITAQMVKPLNWESIWLGTFGIWGPEKMRIMVDVTGMTDWSKAITDQNLLNYYKQLCIRVLQTENEGRPENDKLKEPDGTLVEFPNK